MADKATTTKRDAPPGDEDVQAAIDQLRETMIARGDDPMLVDAQLRAVRPRETNLVGNFADLQRLGGMQATETGGTADAFALPADVSPETGQTRGA